MLIRTEAVPGACRSARSRGSNVPAIRSWYSSLLRIARSTPCKYAGLGAENFQLTPEGPTSPSRWGFPEDE